MVALGAQPASFGSIDRVIEKFNNFIDECHSELPHKMKDKENKPFLYRDMLQYRLGRGKNHMVIDFTELIRHDPELGEKLLEFPEECLKAFTLSLSRYDTWDAYKSIIGEFTFRFTNLTRNIKWGEPSSRLLLKDVRVEHIGKFKVFEGVVRLKERVKAATHTIHFKCNQCGNDRSVLQLGLKLTTPKTCVCGARGERNFRKVKEDNINTFKMLIEEQADVGMNPDFIERYVLCNYDLTDRTLYDKFGPGTKVRITGWASKLPPKNGDNATEAVFCINANYIEILSDGFEKIVLTDEKRARIREWVAAQSDVTDSIANEYYSEVHGWHNVKLGLTLQMFGGVRRKVGRSFSRGDIHIFLVGDPAIAKSKFLETTEAILPKVRFTNGAGVSGVGLTAGLTKDEFLGGWVLQPGALPLSNGGTLIIDELDKASEEDTNFLHDAMERQEVSIDKVGTHVTLPTKTTILAGANPKHGKFSSHKSVFEQLLLPTALITRFDLIFVFRENALSEQDHEAIVRRMISGHKKIDDTCEEEEKDTLRFLHEYVSYARTIRPVVTDEAEEFFVKKYNEFKKRSQRTEISFPVTPRTIDAIRRLSQARARMLLKEEVGLDEVEYVYKIMNYAFINLGVDPLTGTLEGTEERIALGGRYKPEEKLFEVLLDYVGRVYGRTQFNLEDLYPVFCSDVPEAERIECKENDGLLRVPKKNFKQLFDKWYVNEKSRPASFPRVNIVQPRGTEERYYID